MTTTKSQPSRPDPNAPALNDVAQGINEFRRYIDGMAKAMNVFGDTIRATDYYEMFKYGRQNTQNFP